MPAGQELDATAQALTGLLAGLTAGHARQALAAAVAGNGDVRFHAARYYSLRRFLAAHPGALSSGAVITAADRPRLVAPQDVKRLAAALLAAGRSDVAIPVRRCAAGCHEVRDNWSARQGCIRCDIGHALADCVRLVTGLLDGMPGDQARSCLLAAAGGGTSRNTAARLRVIAGHLRGQPGALASGETTAPIDVLRLISELRRAGRSDVAQPRCADCGRDRFLRAHRPDGQRVCASCSQAYHLPERCGRCGRQARVCARDPGGGAVCERCRRADPAAWKPCGICGHNDWTRITINGTRIGDCCYLHPHERCSACGLGRAVSPYKTRKATCAACASAPLAACSSCGLDAMVPQAGEAPLCLRCASGATRPCASCQAPTVNRSAGGEPRCPGCYSRPRRACGRCGRVRVIVRLAAGADPELCGSCWTGPVTRCGKCGRQRPCRGEHSGQMLCRSCQPRPKRECAYCGHRRKVTVVWRDGPACASCYRAAMRAKGDCPGCGQHRRLLPRRGTGQDLCAGCAGAPPGPVCGDCGNEDWLYHKGRCARCVLKTRLARLLGSEPERTTRGLQPLHEALLAAERPEAVISWLQPERPGPKILARLASGEMDLSHTALDTVADLHRNATGHITALLTALGALPRRDTHLACLERDIAAILDGTADQDMRRLLRRYATWGLLRHARAKARQAPLTSGIRHGQTARLKTAVHFTSWLASRGLALAACRQPDLDTYLLACPARRDEVRHFLAWGRRYRDRALTVAQAPPPGHHGPAGPGPAMARSLLHDNGHDPGDRVAGLLVLLFGQRPGRIASLTTSHISLDAGRTTLTLGTTPISIPEPLASHLHVLARHRRHLSQVLAGGPGPWLFPGLHPGQPVLPVTISHRLARIGIDTVTGRASALLQLAGELPPTVVADLLGLRTKTAIAWGQLAGRPWAAYPALLDRQRP
jgi:integrase